MDKFEQASRCALRFTYRGLISTEDLWCLRDTDLDAIYTSLKKNQSAAQEGLLKKPTAADKENELRLEIVKHVFEAKQAEKAARVAAEAARAQRDKIMEVIANKQDEGLRSKSIEELQAMLAAQEAAV